MNVDIIDVLFVKFITAIESFTTVASLRLIFEISVGGFNTVLGGSGRIGGHIGSQSGSVRPLVKALVHDLGVGRLHNGRHRRTAAADFSNAVL